MSENKKNTMAEKDTKPINVSCYLGEKPLCNLTWDELPNTGMSFNYKKREYVILSINDSKITVKDITKGAKNK